MRRRSRPILQGLTRQLNRMAKAFLEAEIKAMEDPAGSLMQILKLQESEARGLDKLITCNIWGLGQRSLTEKDFIEILDGMRGKRPRIASEFFVDFTLKEGRLTRVKNAAVRARR